MKKYRLHWSIHPEKDEAWYEAECLRSSPDEIAREQDINYSLSVSGRVFSAYNDIKHMIKGEVHYNPLLPVYRVWDFGNVNCVLYAQIDKHGRKRFLHERILGSKMLDQEPSNILEQARVAMQDARELFPDVRDWIDICDPAGSYHDHRGAKTEVDYLGDSPYNLYLRYENIRDIPTRERRKRAMTMITKDLQEAPMGIEAFGVFADERIETGCPILRKALQGAYCFKKDNHGNVLDKIKEPNHPYEEVIDCLFYLYIEANAYGGGDYYSSEISPIFDDGYIDPYIGV